MVTRISIIAEVCIICGSQRLKCITQTLAFASVLKSDSLFSGQLWVFCNFVFPAVAMKWKMCC